MKDAFAIACFLVAVATLAAAATVVVRDPGSAERMLALWVR